MRFEGKVALVTGAATGIGFEIADQLAKEGAQVIINDLNKEKLIEAEKTLNNLYPNCIKSFCSDASNVADIKSLMEFCVNSYGKIDIAIANAGITLFGDFLNFSEQEFDSVINLNLKGSFFLAQSFAKQIKVQKTAGKFIVMSSTVGTQSFSNLAAYAMTKSALKMLARSLVKDFSALNININCVAPGATLTERTALEGENYAKNWAEVIPINDIAYPIDIAKTILFLVSDDARHIQGQTILVDGGWSSVSPLPMLY